jgi:hypothetical protein
MAGAAIAKQVGELAERGEDIDQAKPRNGSADEVVRQHGPDDRQRLDKVVAVPERRPRNQDQQESRFEQEGDKQQTSEQGSAFGLDR